MFANLFELNDGGIQVLRSPHALVACTGPGGGVAGCSFFSSGFVSFEPLSRQCHPGFAAAHALPLVRHSSPQRSVIKLADLTSPPFGLKAAPDVAYLLVAIRRDRPGPAHKPIVKFVDQNLDLALMPGLTQSCVPSDWMVVR